MVWRFYIFDKDIYVPETRTICNLVIEPRTEWRAPP